MLAIIDYGAGNLHSVKNALDFLGAESIVTSEKSVILSADKVILPGVGAFGDAMAELNKSGRDETIKEVVKKGTPILGICLGMQLFFDESEETPGVKGLGILGGKFLKIPKDEGLKIPHMGWNNLLMNKDSKILKDLGSEPYVYFVHSYYHEPNDPDDVSAFTLYGKKIAVSAERDNIFLTQFHPEKSGDTGLKILKNFLEA